MAKSLKVNYIFNMLNTVTGLLFPLITFPYASRIMLADGIGQVNFFQSIIQYITLLTCLGIPMYAIRKIASVRDDVAKRNKVATEILLLHASLSLIGYVIVALLATFVADIQVNIPLFLILSLTIFFTAIGCEWFYQGIEDFKYITIRGLIVKTIAVILLFVFVRTKEDILWYAGYLVFGILGGNIFNFIRLRKYISWRNLLFKELHPLVHLKPALHIFVLNLVISLYVNLNSIMLGFMADNTSVGLFTAATKLSHVLLSLVSALGTVMLPRLSNLISTGQKEKFNELAQKSITVVMALTLPLTSGLIMTAKYLIPLFCGNSYEPAILTLQIISPIIIMIGISNVLGIQILYPQGQENKVILCTALGALVNLVLNIWLIPRYAQDGAAVSTLLAETMVTVSMIFIGKKYIPIRWKSKSFVHYFVATCWMTLALYFVSDFFKSNVFNFVFSIMVGMLVYGAWLLIIREQFSMQMINRFLNIKR
ncbi:flippase [Phocaeicola salanitronis]|uniref:flippase n=1 Tax=Phocaeicola salanitronis TaxID=376805 RepID=UPI0032094A9C